MQKALLRGNKEVYGPLSAYYYSGCGTDVDLERATVFIRLAAINADEESIFNLGALYLKKANAECSCDSKEFLSNTNAQKMFKIFQLAAKRGSVKALEALGIFCYNNNHISDHEVKAFRCFEKAAELGSEQGSLMTGYCYLEGIGVPVDCQKAMSLLVPLADKGNSDAAYFVGSIHFTKSCENPDDGTALKYLLIATDKDKNNADALFLVGFCYFKGRGVNKDILLGKLLIESAARSGCQQAIKTLELIKELEKQGAKTKSSITITIPENSDILKRSILEKGVSVIKELVLSDGQANMNATSLTNEDAASLINTTVSGNAVTTKKSLITSDAILTDNTGNISSLSNESGNSSRNNDKYTGSITEQIEELRNPSFLNPQNKKSEK